MKTPLIQFLFISLVVSIIACDGNKNQVKDNTTKEQIESQKIIPDANFLAFVAQFPELSSLNINKEQVEVDWQPKYHKIAADSVLKYIYHLDLAKKDSLLKHLKNGALSLPYTSSSEEIMHEVEMSKIVANTIKYYAVGQLNLSDQFKSIVILYKDSSPDAMLVGHRYSLINYKLDGSPISFTDIAYGEKYMSYRIHECTLEKDLLKIMFATTYQR